MTLLSLFNNTTASVPQTLIWGEDDFLNDYIARSYTKEDKFKDLDRITVDCENDGLDELIANLTESILFSTQKVVIVKNPFFLTSKVAKKFKKQLDQLQEIFSHSDELDDVIVMVASYEKLDKRKKITKTVMNNFNVINLKIKSYEVSAIAKSIIKAEGYIITQSALQLLVERSDQVMDTILSNYSKLKIVAQNQKITEKMVAENIELSLAQNVFEILEAAFNGNYQQALTRLENQLREGVNPIQLLAVFESQIEILLVVKILAERRRSETQIVKELGIHPYRVKLALKKRIAIEKLEHMLEKAIELDFKYKNGTYQSDEFLKMYILNA